MHARLSIPLLAATLTGCLDTLTLEDVDVLKDGDRFSVGEEEPLDANLPPPAPEYTDDNDQGWFWADCVGGPDAMPATGSDLLVLGGPGEILVTHTGILAGDDPRWNLFGTVDEVVRLIDMVYQETNPEPSGETCVWEINYTILGVPPGDWTLRARGDSQTVEVTPP